MHLEAYRTTIQNLKAGMRDRLCSTAYGLAKQDGLIKADSDYEAIASGAHDACIDFFQMEKEQAETAAIFEIESLARIGDIERAQTLYDALRIRAS